MKFDCETCGKIDEAYFDGYSVGDRILEGVMFVARKSDDGSCTVSLAGGTWEKDPYLAQLDKTYWMPMLEEYAGQNDVFECPACGGDVVPDDML
jgi:hypothetical protein